MLESLFSHSVESEWAVAKGRNTTAIVLSLFLVPSCPLFPSFSDVNCYFDCACVENFGSFHIRFTRYGVLVSRLQARTFWLYDPKHCCHTNTTPLVCSEILSCSCLCLNIPFFVQFTFLPLFTLILVVFLRLQRMCLTAITSLHSTRTSHHLKVVSTSRFSSLSLSLSSSLLVLSTFFHIFFPLSHLHGSNDRRQPMGVSINQPRHNLIRAKVDQAMMKKVKEEETYNVNMRVKMRGFWLSDQRKDESNFFLNSFDAII